MIGKGFVSKVEYDKHLAGDWRTVHNLWRHIRNYMVTYASELGDAYTKIQMDAGQMDTRYYTEAELNAGQMDTRYYTETETDAFFEGYSGGKAQVDAGNVVGLTQGSIPFADSSGFLTEDNSNLFWDDTKNTLGIGTTSFGANMVLGIQIKTGTAPTGNVADTFAFYSADFVAGNACPYFRTENGTVIGLNQSLLTTDNVVFGTIGCGTITVANGASINLQEDITFLGATTENLIKFPDNLPDAFSFMEGANPYQTFITTNDSEAIQFHKDVGINLPAPIVPFHVLVTGQSRGLVSGNLSNPDYVFVGESNNCIIGLASTDAGGHGSGIDLMEVDAGTLADKWTIVREPSSGGSDFMFRYGTNADYSTNSKIFSITTAGVVICGGTSPTLHLANGSITDGSGAINFANENLSTSGTITTTTRLGVGAVPSEGGAKSIHIKGTDTGVTPYGTDFLIIENNGNIFWEMISSNTGIVGFMFTDTDLQEVGRLYYYHNGDYFRFKTGGTHSLIYKGGNLGLEVATFGTNAARVLAIAHGTVPESSPADCFQMYAEDIVAGHNACHIRNENDTVIKLYQQALIADPAGQANDLDSEARTAIDSILDILENNGLMANA